VRITQFQERTVDDLAKQLADMYKQGPLKGIVLDLRNDPGGLLHAAVGVSAVFLPPDSTVVTTEDAPRTRTAVTRRTRPITSARMAMTHWRTCPRRSSPCRWSFWSMERALRPPKSWPALCRTTSGRR